MPTAAELAAARGGDRAVFDRIVAPHRRALLIHAYRMLGSLADAEDALQETLVRAWQRLASFEARGTLRAWLYRIATNACLDALASRPARSIPPLRHPPSSPGAPLAPRVEEPVWLEPFPDDDPLTEDALDPERALIERESVRLAFVAALQHLTPRQRAAVILCDVLGWRAAEAAALLDSTVDGVNGALHRGRTVLASARDDAPPAVPAAAGADAALLARFIAAWERGDVAALATLLARDAIVTMPPVPTWFAGRDAVVAFLRSDAFAPRWGQGFRALPTRANGLPALALYVGAAARGPARAHSLVVLDTRGGTAVHAIVAFIVPSLLPRFGFPLELPPAG